MMKKFFVYFIVATLFLSVVFMGSQQVIATDSSTTETYNIGLIYATGGKGDKSFNDAAWRGLNETLDKYADDADVDINFVEREPTEIPEFETYQEELASNASMDLIICVGFLQTSALNQTARTYPNQKFVLIDDVIDLENINSITFKEHEGSFLVGAMAAMTTNTSTIGFLGGLDIYLINKFRVGYEQGAQFVNPDIEVIARYSPNPDNPWGDLAGGKQVAETMHGQGADIIYAAAGGTGIGVIQYANETDGCLAIGVDSDQDYLAPGDVLCSMIKKVETAVTTSVDAIVEDTWSAGHTRLGLAEDGVGISPMTYTQNYANAMYTLNGEEDTAWNHVMDIKQQIIDGDIVVETPETETTGAPGFTTDWLLFALIPVAAAAIRKRRK